MVLVGRAKALGRAREFLWGLNFWRTFANCDGNKETELSYQMNKSLLLLT